MSQAERLSGEQYENLSRRDFLKLGKLGIESLVWLTAPSELKKIVVGVVDREKTENERDVERLRLIEKYGVAEKVPAFEFHGDYYNFYNGGYCMDPETFEKMMNWFKSKEVWTANDEEVIGYLDGTVQLPARSAILTTDSGNLSQKSLSRMIPVLQETRMHFISFVWTNQMNEGESIACKKDACWQSFREALKSGVFSVGSHTETHRDFQKLKKESGLWDLLKSKQEIENNLGVTPKLISWPFESVPDWAGILTKYGFRAGFAGNSRRVVEEGYVLPKDTRPWSLPRILPPNSVTNLSGRPNGKTLEEIMASYTNGFGKVEGEEMQKQWPLMMGRGKYGGRHLLRE